MIKHHHFSRSPLCVCLHQHYWQCKALPPHAIQQEPTVCLFAPALPPHVIIIWAPHVKIKNWLPEGELSIWPGRLLFSTITLWTTLKGGHHPPCTHASCRFMSGEKMTHTYAHRQQSHQLHGGCCNCFIMIKLVDVKTYSKIETSLSKQSSVF